MVDDWVFEYDLEKDARLQRERNVGFEFIIAQIADGKLLGVYAHPNRAKYPHQLMLAVDVLGYVYAVPAVRKGNRMFLKTIYPSRKSTRQFLKEGTL